MKTCAKCGLRHTNTFEVCTKCNEPLVLSSSFEVTADQSKDNLEVRSSISNNNRDVTISDINIPFISMVIFMVKWSLASIPAFLILLVIGAVFGALFSGLLGSILR